MTTSTSILWRKDRTPQWGDESLTRGLSLWGKKISAVEAKFLFRGLLFSTLAAPIEKPIGSAEENPALRLAKSEGRWGVPLFTHPDLLAKFARSQKWAEDSPWTPVAAREAFRTLSQVEGVECWINPPESSLKLDQDALKQLAAGQIPDPKTLGAKSRQTLPITINVVAPKTLRPAGSMVPDRVTTAIKIVLAQFPEISSATLYKPAEGPVTLGLKVQKAGAIVRQECAGALRRILANFDPPISIETLTPAMEQELGSITPPFYWKKS